jgi:hypothetical protein
MFPSVPSSLRGAVVALAFGLMFTPALDRARGEEPSGGKKEALREEAFRQQLARLGVDRWHKAGLRGQGVKVLVLDHGFPDYRHLLGKTLPREVTTQSFRDDGNLRAREGLHGVRCAEVIHALAPEAELFFANWDFHDPASFIKAVQWAKGKGVQVIACSAIQPGWSDCEGGGTVHTALKRVLGSGDRPGDLLFLASAGDTGRGHWRGKFFKGKNGLHEWEDGDEINRLAPAGETLDGEIRVGLFFRPGTSYLLQVYDRTAETYVASHETVEHYWGVCGWGIRFLPEAGHNYEVHVRYRTGRGDRFHLIAQGADLEHRKWGGLCFPADGAEVLTVGAVDERGRRMPRSPYGSEGLGPKPELVGAVPFVLPGEGQAFGDTSAAAAQATALAALIWGRERATTPTRVKADLLKGARRLGEGKYSAETGYGLVRLPEAAKVKKGR